MNYQENEQLEGGQGSTQQNQNPTGQPQSGDTGGTLDDNNGLEEDWSDDEPMADEGENIESGIVEEEDGDEFEDDAQEDGLTDHYDQDEVGDSTYDRDENGTGLDEDDDEVRNQTMI